MRSISRSGSHKEPAGAMAAAIVILVCLFSHPGAMGLVGPDEPRYAWIARAMATGGDWVTPRLYGQPWFEKPVLYYWVAAVGFRLHLTPEWAARLPSALAALAAAVSLSCIARKHYGRVDGWLRSAAFAAPLVFSTSVAAIGFARGATPDMLFATTLTLAMAIAAGILRRAGILATAFGAEVSATQREHVPLALFGACLGLAVLAKGPAGLALAVGAMVLWGLATKRWIAALRFANPIAIIAFFIVSLPWYVLCARRNPDFLRVFLFEHNFQRYTTPLFQHKQPFWFFGPILLLALLPWTILLIPVAQHSLRRLREKQLSHSPALFFACWGVFPLLFFSFSQSKLPGYILPAIAPFSLILALMWVRLASSNSASLRWVTIGLGLSWLGLGLSAAHWMDRLPAGARDALAHTIYFCAALAIAGGLAIAGLGFTQKRGVLAVSVFLVTLLVEIAGARVLPSLDPYLSARWHAELLREDQRPDRLFTFHLQRSWNYGLAFYFGRELPEWSPDNPEAALILTTPRGLEELRRLGRIRDVLPEDYKGILYVPVQPAPH